MQAPSRLFAKSLRHAAVSHARHHGTLSDDRSGIRHIPQPGPVDPVRIESLEGSGQALELVLKPGLSLIDAIAKPLLAAGFEAAAVRLEGGSLMPFTYLIPAASTEPRYAAYYSAPFTPLGETRIEVANVSVGRRDGQPFLHCHGIWVEADGSVAAGTRSPIRPSSLLRPRFKLGVFPRLRCALSSIRRPTSRSSTLFRLAVPPRAVGRGWWWRAFVQMRTFRTAWRQSAENMASLERSCAAASAA